VRIVALLTAKLAASWAATQEPAAASDEGLRLFREVVAPLFAGSCAECHNAENRKGDLDLTSRDALLFGGESGSPLNGDDPLLLRLIEHREKPFMPKKKPQLDAAVVTGIKRWMELGAPYEGVITPHAEQWWSFGALRAAPPPAAGNAVDAFVRADLTGQPFAPEATRQVLIRRLWHDLLGLAPTRAEVEAFVADRRPDAWERLVETALASPRYGERWGRHWLDAARYADSAGYEFDLERPHSWPYRDFVIQATNEDLPWDQFLRWQLAGDELAPDDPRALAATGFLTVGPRVDNQVIEQNRYDEIDDMIATTGSAMLGLTVACARCHDHKYDPIPAKDYYALSAAFVGTEFVDLPLGTGVEWRYATDDPGADWAAEEFDDAQWSTGPGGFGTAATPGAVLGTEWSSPEIWLRRSFEWGEEPFGLWLHHDDDFEVWLNGELIHQAEGFLVAYEYLELPQAKPRQGRNLLAVRCRQTWGGQYVDAIPLTKEALQQAGRGQQMVLALRDRGAEPAPAWLLDRGIAEAKKEAVTLGFLGAVGDGSRAPSDYLEEARATVDASRTSGQRAALGLWLTDVEHGAGALAARVQVNRIWQHHFGRGLVGTAGDFGIQGDAPSHPELLEWLAAEFVRSGWSVKAMHRLILGSATWRQRSSGAELRRVEGEILRDRILQSSGCLNLEMGGPAVMPWIHPDAIATGSTKKWAENVVDGPATWRRSVYVMVRRSVMFPMFEAFDAPAAQQACTRRNVTTTPLQALALMNSAFVRDQARHFAARLEAEAPGNREKQVEIAFWHALSRPPDAQERADARAFLEQSPLADFCQLMFALDEFAYLD
jgi:cytochrome c553